MSRYAGSEILKYQAKEFDRYVVPTGPSESSHRGPTSLQAYEGRITRLHYRAPVASNRAEDGRAKNRRVELVEAP